MTVKNKELHRLNIIFGIVLLFVFLYMAYMSNSMYCLGLVIAFGLFTKTSGVQFDSETYSYRKYKHLCFWTRGKWKKIGDNKQLVVLTKHGVKTTIGATHSTLQIKGGFSELYLMDESHTRRLYISSSENHDSIDGLALRLGQFLNIPIKPFNPKK